MLRQLESAFVFVGPPRLPALTRPKILISEEGRGETEVDKEERRWEVSGGRRGSCWAWWFLGERGVLIHPTPLMKGGRRRGR